MLSWRNRDVHLQSLEKKTRARLNEARSSPIRKLRASAKRAKRLIKSTIMAFSSRPQQPSSTIRKLGIPMPTTNSSQIIFYI